MFNSQLYRCHVIGVGQFDHGNLILTFHRFHPFVRLALRIDHQRPSGGAEDDNTILDRKIVGRKPVNIPRPNQNRFA